MQGIDTQAPHYKFNLSPFMGRAELGCHYLRLDRREAMYGGEARLMEKLPLAKFPYPLLYDHPLGSRLRKCPLPSKSACSGFDRRLD
jgi:hypothetical protein